MAAFGTSPSLPSEKEYTFNLIMRQKKTAANCLYHIFSMVMDCSTIQ